MNEKDNARKYGRYKISWMFIFTAIIVVLYVVSVLFWESSWLFLLLLGILLFLQVCLNFAWVKSLISTPLLFLLRGMLEDKRELPADHKGPIGKAAQAYLDLTNNYDLAKSDLEKAQKEIAKLTARGSELDGQIAKLKSTADTLNADMTKQKNEIGGLKKQSASDNEKIETLTRDYDGLMSQTSAFFDAVICGEYRASYDRRFYALSSKSADVCRHISDLSYKTDSLKKEVDKLTAQAAAKPIIQPALQPSMPQTFAPKTVTGTAPKTVLPAAKTDTAIKPAARKRPVSNMVISTIKPTGFDGSNEYNRKDFGKY